MATRPGYASIFVRLIFSLVLVAHIPYVFFTTKEACLVFIDEIWHKSVSEKLEAKIQANKEKSDDMNLLLKDEA